MTFDEQDCLASCFGLQNSSKGGVKKLCFSGEGGKFAVEGIRSAFREERRAVSLLSIRSSDRLSYQVAF